MCDVRPCRRSRIASPVKADRPVITAAPLGWITPHRQQGASKTSRRPAFRTTSETFLFRPNLGQHEACRPLRQSGRAGFLGMTTRSARRRLPSLRPACRPRKPVFLDQQPLAFEDEPSFDDPIRRIEGHVKSGRDPISSRSAGKDVGGRPHSLDRHPAVCGPFLSDRSSPSPAVRQMDPGNRPAAFIDGLHAQPARFAQ